MSFRGVELSFRGVELSLGGVELSWRDQKWPGETKSVLEGPEVCSSVDRLSDQTCL